MRGMILATLFTVLSLCIGTQAVADTSTTAFGYTIHHNALTTDTVPAEVASAYNLRRSKNRGMLNVSVLHHTGTGQGTAVAATVNVVAQNLIGQKLEIPMREIREGQAIYYIGDFPVANRDSFKFSITVQPEGTGQTLTAELVQAFFTD